MSETGPLPELHIRIGCASEGVFLRDVAPKLSARFWIATDVTAAIGDRVKLSIELEVTSRRAWGVARVLVASHGRLCLRLVSLEPSSIQFPLGAAGGANAEDILLPGVYREQPHPYTEAPTPPHGHKISLPVAPPRSSPPAHKISLPIAPPRSSPPSVTAVSPPAATPVRPRPPHPSTPQPPDPHPNAPPVSAPWSGGLRPLDTLENFQLLDRLGVGGMAEVYVARALIGGVEKIMALKLVLPQFGPGTEHGGMFLSEARIAAMLQHPGLVQVFAFGESAGRPYLAMEYVVGRDLGRLLKRMWKVGLQPSIPFALSVISRVLQALDFLHGKVDSNGEYLRLVHRDVSPGNVLVSEFGEVKIVDFGVASVDAGQGERIVAGKPGYMCLEQAAGLTPSPSWDLYAVGVLLHELLTLKKHQPNTPFEPPSSMNPKVSHALDVVVQRATNVDPELRYISAKQMLEALQPDLDTAGGIDLGDMVRRLLGDAMAEEKKRVAEATLKARDARPARLGKLSQLRRVALRTELGKVLATRAQLRLAVFVAAGLLAAAVGGTVVKQIASARALSAQLGLMDERMRVGALSGQGESALGALMTARSLDAQDPRVEARAKELARVFELLGDTALARGNRAEAAVHFESLGVADPGRPGLIAKLIAAHANVARP